MPTLDHLALVNSLLKQDRLLKQNMAPSAIEVEAPQVGNGALKQKIVNGRQPLRYSGTLDQFKSEEITPVIGTEYPETNLVELLKSPNADELLRDLAVKSKVIRAYLRTRTSGLTAQSRNGASFFSGNRTTSQTISRSNSSSDLVRSLENLQVQDCISTRF